MKKLLFVLCVLMSINASAQSESKKDTNSWGSKLKQSNFHLGLDLQTKYMWRGMEMMVEDSSPVLFPSVSYSNNGLYMYVMGGNSLNGKYAEVDLGVSYTWKWLTIGLNDYYYPSVTSSEDNYFDLNKNTTGHWLEGVVTIAPEKIPAYLTISNFFYGADKRLDGKQAYSTYFELGTYYDFLDNNKLSFAIGAACNKSCYNGYEHGVGICNVELKYTYNVAFKNGWALPLNVAYIVNPIYEKSFVNFSTSLAF